MPYSSALNDMTSKQFGDGYEAEIGKQWHQPSAFWTRRSRSRRS